MFSSGIMVLQCNDDFVIDFLSMLVPPQQVVARVVMSGATFAKFVVALQVNVAEYQREHGPVISRETPTSGRAAANLGQMKPQTAPQEPAVGANEPSLPPNYGRSIENSSPQGTVESGVPVQTPSGKGGADISEFYDQLKLPDDLLGGAYATGAIIRHTSAEFTIDFLANFYPRAVVTTRIFLAARRVLVFLETCQNSLRRYRQGPTDETGANRGL